MYVHQHYPKRITDEHGRTTVVKDADAHEAQVELWAKTPPPPPPPVVKAAPGAPNALDPWLRQSPEHKQLIQEHSRLESQHQDLQVAHGELIEAHNDLVAAHQALQEQLTAPDKDAEEKSEGKKKKG